MTATVCTGKEKEIKPQNTIVKPYALPQPHLDSKYDEITHLLHWLLHTWPQDEGVPGWLSHCPHQPPFDSSGFLGVGMLSEE